MSAGARASTIAGRGLPKIGLIFIIVAVIGALWAIDVFLRNIEEGEMQSLAQEAYSSGTSLLAQGKINDAVDALRRAHALERGNLAYDLELVTALTAAGKTSDAEPLMSEVLDEDRNDGAANLVAARLRLKEENIRDAEAYYHRAIYGEWPKDAAAHRIAARLELINLLSRKDKKQELLAELLPLQEEAGKDPALQTQLAQLFLIAGSPSRAAEVYRMLIGEEPNNADGYAGLGEAELEQGDYRTAHSAFAEACARKPDDSAMRSKLQLAATLAALDPTPRWLTSKEKYRRSLRIIGEAQQNLEKCIQSQSAGASAEQQRLLEQAEDVMNRKAPMQATNELSEQALALAQKIWQARMNACGAATPDEEVLRLIMGKLAQ